MREQFSTAGAASRIDERAQPLTSNPVMASKSLAAAALQRAGEGVWTKMVKTNSELFSLTYGAMVRQLLADHEDVAVVNQQLEKMGHNIGCRLIDEFLSKSGVGGSSCTSFKDTAEVMAKVAFKMFLGVTAEVAGWNVEGTAFSLLMPADNPFVDFVELPPQYRDLHYCGLLCGVVVGACEMVQMKVECRFVRDALKGDDVSEMRVELKGIVKNAVADDYRE